MNCLHSLLCALHAFVVVPAFSLFCAGAWAFALLFFYDRACFPSLAFPTSVMKGTRELEKGLLVPYRCGTTQAIYIYAYVCTHLAFAC
jgi:hypothetical protein